MRPGRGHHHAVPPASERAAPATCVARPSPSAVPCPALSLPAQLVLLPLLLSLRLLQHALSACATVPAVLHSLFAKLREAHASDDVKAIVVTGAAGRFSAGFDVSEFANPDSKGTDPG